MKMNYKVFKTLIDWIIKGHICKDCGAKCSQEDVEIMGTAGNAVNLNINCPKCSKQNIVRAEVSQVEIDADNIWKSKDLISKVMKDWIFWGTNIQELSEKISRAEALIEKSKESIKDEDIVSINKELKNASSIEDLLK